MDIGEKIYCAGVASRLMSLGQGGMMNTRWLALVLSVTAPISFGAGPLVAGAQPLAVDLPAELRANYRNPDGSCVQCSIGMVGTDQNVRAAATILWDTECGKAERGGSWPARTAEYCRERGIRCYNITGSQSLEWAKWACRTGRGAAIGLGTAHFQTLMGYDPATETWYACDNNSTHKIDEYTDKEFRRKHAQSGPWVWIADYPPHPARPRYIAWWSQKDKKHSSHKKGTFLFDASLYATKTYDDRKKINNLYSDFSVSRKSLCDNDLSCLKKIIHDFGVGVARREYAQILGVPPCD